MDHLELLRIARLKQQANAAQRRADTRFTLVWRGGGASELLGYAALAEQLGIKQSSIPVLLSQGGGASFTLTRPSPLTGEPDVLTVLRALPVKSQRKRGRPSKAITHASDERLGTQFAESARTMPKQTNRRTYEKPD